MNWDSLGHLQNFFRLDFLFSGLEISSSWVFAARLLIFVLFGAGVIWGLLKLMLKVLDCLQTFLQSLTQFPRVFFILLLLAVPMSSDSLGAQWIGYILMTVCVLCFGFFMALTVVLWKYGVDHAIRFVDALRSYRRDKPNSQPETALPPDNLVTPMVEAPVPMSREFA
ncbi:hypothetical protein ACFL2Q_03395 [Thermodesulfobacteriota bacterium]